MFSSSPSFLVLCCAISLTRVSFYGWTEELDTVVYTILWDFIIKIQQNTVYHRQRYEICRAVNKANKSNKNMLRSFDWNLLHALSFCHTIHFDESYMRVQVLNSVWPFVAKFFPLDSIRFLIMTCQFFGFFSHSRLFVVFLFNSKISILL